MSFVISKATTAAAVSASGTITFAYPSIPISGNPSYPYPFEPNHVNANPPPPQPLEQTSAGDFQYSNGHYAISSSNQARLVFGKDFSLTFNTPIASGITMTLSASFASTIPAGSVVTLQLEFVGQNDGAVFKVDSRIGRGSISPAAVIRFGSPLAAVTTGVVNAAAVAVTTVVTLGTAVVLDAPRNLTYVSSSAGDTTQTITVRGLDEFGNAMTEVKTLNGTTSVVGAKAFKTVISYQASAALAGTLSLGFGVLLGLPVALEATAYVIQDITDGAKSGTAGAYVKADNTIPSGTTGDVRGTFSPNTAPNGVHQYELVVFLPDPTSLGLAQYAGE